MNHEARKELWSWLGGDNATFVPSDEYAKSFCGRLMTERFENAGPVEAGRLEEELLCGYEIPAAAIDLMTAHGGSFAKDLAKAYNTADLENRMYLVRGLSHIFEPYVTAVERMQAA